ncbi:hypothetical protein GF354_00490 [Candidatus Peregrinibacteria bacterium]|nr:hypothetical protein [Candidatus Peregrinibacteria bacterium]
MIWQDAVITGANILFSISLIPQIHYGFKNKVGPIRYQTSIPTTLGLIAISIALFSLSLYLSTALTGLSAILWFTLFIQKVIYKT